MKVGKMIRKGILCFLFVMMLCANGNNICAAGSDTAVTEESIDVGYIVEVPSEKGKDVFIQLGNDGGFSDLMLVARKDGNIERYVVDEIIENIAAFHMEDEIDLLSISGTVDGESFVSDLKELDETEGEEILTVNFEPGMGIKNSVLRKDGEYIVVIDPGHSAKSVGTNATWDGVFYQESELVMKIARYLGEELEQYSGVTVYFTRDEDSDREIEDRVKYAQSMNADILVSIHVNSTAKPNDTASGVLAIVAKIGTYNTDNAQSGQELGRKILDELVALGFRDRGFTIQMGEGTYPDGSQVDSHGIIKFGQIYDIPSVIVEHGFLNNENDFKKYLSTEEGLKSLGIADAIGIANYLGLEKGKSDGWRVIDGKTYYYDENEKPVTGTPIIDGKKYWFDSDGVQKTGWLYLLDWKMYFDPDTGEAAVGMKDINGKKYLFNSDGVMQNYAGTTVIDGKKYWFSDDNASLKTGWLNLGNWKMYFDPETYVAKTGLAEIDGQMYIFNKDGVMQGYPGTPVINGEKYWVATEGYLKSGWLYLGDWKMYFDPVTYTAKTGITEMNGKKYLFTKDGVMQTYAGTTVVEGKKYWFSTDDASLKAGWLDLLGMKLYFDPDTYQGVTGFATIESKDYYFDKNGVMQTGLQTIGKALYYFDKNGVMQKNVTKTVNGVKWEFGADGVCINSVFTEDYEGPYEIYVDRVNCVITIYGDDGSGNFEYPIKAFVCSVGASDTPTPKGTYYTGDRYKVKALMGPSWGQYAIHIVNGVYFHSVAASSATDPGHTVPVGGYYKLGRPASHGCVRMLVGDAYWMYTHIPRGTKVIIGDNFPMPLGKPSVPEMVTPGVDPTDPFNK